MRRFSNTDAVSLVPTDLQVLDVLTGTWRHLEAESGYRFLLEFLSFREGVCFISVGRFIGIKLRVIFCCPFSICRLHSNVIALIPEMRCFRSAFPYLAARASVLFAQKKKKVAFGFIDFLYFLSLLISTLTVILLPIWGSVRSHFSSC